MGQTQQRSPWPRLKDLKPGDKLRADGGFTCLCDGEQCVVKRDNEFGESDKVDGSDLYVDCAGPVGVLRGTYGRPGTKRREEKHFLEGQLGYKKGEGGRVIGFYLVGEMV